MRRKYAFFWNLLGDIEEGRPNLGNTTRVEVYRLMQFTFRDIIEKHVGSVETDEIFYQAGKLAGTMFYQHIIEETDNFNVFIKRVQDSLEELGIGILRVEKADLQKGELTLTVSEDLDCSGLPETGYEVCTYDEGFIGGLLESFTKKSFLVKEIDCWCTGDRTCRFAANVIQLEH